MNTKYIECIDEIVIKNPHGCSMMNDVEMIEIYDITALKQPPSSRYIKSETVTIKGYLNDGTSFLLELPIDSKKQIKMIIDESEIINEEIKEEIGEVL